METPFSPVLRRATDCCSDERRPAAMAELSTLSTAASSGGAGCCLSLRKQEPQPGLVHLFVSAIQPQLPGTPPFSCGGVHHEL